MLHPEVPQSHCTTARPPYSRPRLCQVIEAYIQLLAAAESHERDVPPDTIAVPSLTHVTHDAFVAAVSGAPMVRMRVLRLAALLPPWGARALVMHWLVWHGRTRGVACSMGAATCGQSGAALPRSWVHAPRPIGA